MFLFLFLVGEWIEQEVEQPLESDDINPEYTEPSEPLRALRESQTQQPQQVRNNIWNRNAFSGFATETLRLPRQAVSYSDCKHF